jgi:hypothetical protein
MLKIPKIRQVRCFAVALVLSAVLFSSCGTSTTPEDDSVAVKDKDSIPPNADSVLKADSVVTASYHLSKEDSTHIADSIKKTKDPIRDFN